MADKRSESESSRLSVSGTHREAVQFRMGRALFIRDFGCWIKNHASARGRWLGRGVGDKKGWNEVPNTREGSLGT